MEIGSIHEEGRSSEEIALCDAKEYISILDSEIDRLNKTVSQLLSFVRPKQQIISKVSLDDILSWCESMVKSQAEKQGIALMTGRIGGAVSVLADSEMLRHIVMNLSLNAIQSMDPLDGERKKVLSIGVGRTATVNGTGETGVIRVSDTGPGYRKRYSTASLTHFLLHARMGQGWG